MPDNRSLLDKLLTVKNLIRAICVSLASLAAVLIFWLLHVSLSLHAVVAVLIALLVFGGLAFVGWHFSDKLAQLTEKILNREVLLYLIFGGLTTVIDFIVFYAVYNFLHIDEMIATAIAWCAAVLFAYFTNRRWVFESNETTRRGILREFGMFISARLISLGLSELIVFVVMKLFGFDSPLGSIITKLICAVVVIIFNYVASKLFIFKNDDGEEI